MYDNVFELETVPERAGTSVVLDNELIVVPELDPAVLTIMGQVALGVPYKYINHLNGRSEDSFGLLSARITQHAYSMGMPDVEPPINHISVVNQAFKLGLLRTATYDPQRWPIEPLTTEEDVHFRLGTQGYGLRWAALRSGHSKTLAERYRKNMRTKLGASKMAVAVTIGYHTGLLAPAPQEGAASLRVGTA